MEELISIIGLIGDVFSGGVKLLILLAVILIAIGIALLVGHKTLGLTLTGGILVGVGSALLVWRMKKKAMSNSNA